MPVWGILSFLYRNLYNKWDFEGERNAEITLLDTFFFIPLSQCAQAVARGCRL